MKRYALILLVLLLAGSVRAQQREKNILGVRAGLNLSSYSISESGVSVSTDSRAAFHVAVSDQILLCDRLCLSTSKPDSPFRAAAANYPE